MIILKYIFFQILKPCSRFILGFFRHKKQKSDKKPMKCEEQEILVSSRSNNEGKAKFEVDRRTAAEIAFARAKEKRVRLLSFHIMFVLIKTNQFIPNSYLFIRWRCTVYIYIIHTYLVCSGSIVVTT